MKRNKLEYQLKRIKVRTPRWFWTRCSLCSSHYKHEPMYRWRVGRSGPSGGYFIMWNCMECCPTKTNVVENNEKYFGKHKWGTLHKGDKDALAIKILATPLD